MEEEEVLIDPEKTKFSINKRALPNDYIII
jgi:hypothetical protein